MIAQKFTNSLVDRLREASPLQAEIRNKLHGIRRAEEEKEDSI